MLLSTAPSLAPDVLTAYGMGSTSLILHWRHVTKEFQGQPTGYHISYHPSGAEKNIADVSADIALNTTTLTNLTVYTMYVINVSAVSSGGIGPANTLKARTGAEGTRHFLHDFSNNKKMGYSSLQMSEVVLINWANGFFLTLLTMSYTLPLKIPMGLGTSIITGQLRCFKKLGSDSLLKVNTFSFSPYSRSWKSVCPQFRFHGYDSKMDLLIKGGFSRKAYRL